MKNVAKITNGEGTSRPFRIYLGFEFAFIYFGLPAIFSLNFAGASPILIILAAFVLMVGYLVRNEKFPNSNFFRTAETKPEIKRILKIFAILAPPLVVYLFLSRPELFLSFVREEPLIYALVMVLYPLLSAYPQEIIYRGFLFTRYEPLFGSGMAMVVCSGLAFGFGHVIFLNTTAVALSTAGGMLFAFTYRRSRSLLIATFEHALYGCFVFTIGLGRFFYHGAIQP